ncbi:MAG: cytochrome c3 family protein [Myxococcota bacterium]
MGLGLLAATLLPPGNAGAQIVGSKHDLSVSGQGPVKSSGESEVCIFCHTPHNAAPATPLWNRTLPSLTYTPYSSSTLQSQPGQPTGASKLCLSCHDGTIALGSVLSRAAPIPMTGALPPHSDLTTDLSDDHPVSFVYDSSLAAADPEIVDPTLLPQGIRTDPNGQLQCTSCHEPHSNLHGDFLVVANGFSALCLACHEKVGWPGSAHETSSATWNGAGVDPWPHTDEITVAANGCENCHAPHAAGSAQWLLNELREEDNCLACHEGTVATLDIGGELQKPFRHPVGAFLGLHHPEEDPRQMPRHVECEDCHDPHAATQGSAFPPDVSGPLVGASGVSASGSPVAVASFQYEVCFACHAEGAGVPPPGVTRQILEPSLRLKLDASNPSFHPVEAPGRNPSVPSLLSPLSEASLIYCTDCHASDDGPGSGGSGPAGPHGSIWPALLEREYRTGDGTSESFQAYALCYKCHDRSSILGNQSFSEHRKHIVGERAPCSACHDPHGISVTEGDATHNSHLINFDVDIVSPNPSNGRLEFVDLGIRTGKCSLECHGERHDDKSYRP